jgi:hypothetical protein
MINKQFVRIKVSGLAIIVSLTLHIICSCSDNRASKSNSMLLKSINEKRLLNELVDKYLSKLNAKVKSDIDSSALIVNVGLDSFARLEAFKPFWLKKIAQLKRSDSLDYIFYDSLYKLKLAEQLSHRKFYDSIRFLKSQLRILENKLDSAKRGLFGNPGIGQFARLSIEKGNVYFLSARLNDKDDNTLEFYFGIEEMEQDTIISWTTGKSLAGYMWYAVFRRNSSFWTKGLKKSNKKEKSIESSANLQGFQPFQVLLPDKDWRHSKCKVITPSPA